MKRPSPAMIVALIALVLSMGGTALAAKHYLITSTSQIKPSVLRALERPNTQVGTSLAAPAGATGPAGPEGKQGGEGRTGAAGGSIIGPPGISVTGPEGKRGPEGPEGTFAQVRRYESVAFELAPGEHRNEGLEVRCPSGWPVGGGYEASDQYVNVYASQAAGDWGWAVSAINDESLLSATVTVSVICAE